MDPEELRVYDLIVKHFPSDDDLPRQDVLHAMTIGHLAAAMEPTLQSVCLAEHVAHTLLRFPSPSPAPTNAATDGPDPSGPRAPLEQGLIHPARGEGPEPEEPYTREDFLDDYR